MGDPSIIEKNKASGNTISGNNVTGSYMGSGSLLPHPGGHKYGIQLLSPSDNLVFYNETIGDLGLGQAYCIGGWCNAWDNGTRGNYWGDYATPYPNENNNGDMWGTYYMIHGGGGCQENFPLVTFPPPADPDPSSDSEMMIPGYEVWLVVASSVAMLLAVAAVIAKDKAARL